MTEDTPGKRTCPERSSEDYKRATDLMLAIMKELEAETKGALEIAVGLSELEENNLYKAIDPEVTTMDYFAKQYLHISRSCFYNYRKLQRFCVKDEVTGRLLPRIKEEFQHLNVTELYAFKATDKPSVKKTKSKKFKTKEAMLEWLREKAVTPRSITVQYLDEMDWEKTETKAAATVFTVVSADTLDSDDSVA